MASLSGRWRLLVPIYSCETFPASRFRNGFDRFLRKNRFLLYSVSAGRNATFPFRDNFRAIAPALEFQAIDERRSFGNVWISLDLFLFFLLSVRNWERTFFPVFLFHGRLGAWIVL